MRTKGSEVHAPQHLWCLRTHGQHPLHKKPSSSFVADVSHSTDLATMGQIDVTAYLAPAKPQARKGRAPWSVAGEAASTRALVTSGSIRANDTTLWSLSNYACEQAENPLGFSARLVAAFTARLVRRISCSWTPPKVRSAQLLGSNNACVFIL